MRDWLSRFTERYYTRLLEYADRATVIVSLMQIIVVSVPAFSLYSALSLARPRPFATSVPELLGPTPPSTRS